MSCHANVRLSGSLDDPPVAIDQKIKQDHLDFFTYILLLCIKSGILIEFLSVSIYSMIYVPIPF